MHIKDNSSGQTATMRVASHMHKLPLGSFGPRKLNLGDKLCRVLCVVISSLQEDKLLTRDLAQWLS
jgi:hypothetical protein